MTSLVRNSLLHEQDEALKSFEESLLAQCCRGEINTLSPVVRHAHSGRVQLSGTATVLQGNRLARILCKILRMPPTSSCSKVSIIGEHYRAHMTWCRRFDNFQMDSSFYERQGYFVEVLGPIHMWMAVHIVDGGLEYRLAKAKVFGIPAPSWFAPKVRAREWAEGDVYKFAVEVLLPIVGMLVEYEGEMTVHH